MVVGVDVAQHLAHDVALALAAFGPHHGCRARPPMETVPSEEFFVMERTVASGSTRLKSSTTLPMVTASL